MRTICIDIDGTLTTYIKWIDKDTFGDILPGSVDCITKLKNAGWFIIIYSTRADKSAVRMFLHKQGIPYDAINENPNQPQNAIGGKPLADVYLDDRALTFNGTWEGMYEKIVNFEPWGLTKARVDRKNDQYIELLIADFSQCMELHRHYDVMNWNITKFAFSEIFVAIGAIGAIYPTKEVGIDISAKWLLIAIICGMSFVFGMLALAVIAINRKYFVKTSRHLNEYRSLIVKEHPLNFNNVSGFWCEASFPKYRDWCSTQFLSIYMLGILCAGLSVGLVYAIVRWLSIDTLCLSCIFAPIITLILVFMITYASTNEKK